MVGSAEVRRGLYSVRMVLGLCTLLIKMGQAAGVNARFVGDLYIKYPKCALQALLNEPSMRSGSATLAVLRPLLRQFIDIFKPAQAAATFQATLPVREELYG